MPRTAHPYAPDPRARVIWLFAIVVAGLAAWLLDDAAPERPPAAVPASVADAPAADAPAAGAPAAGGTLELDVVWVPAEGVPDEGTAAGGAPSGAEPAADPAPPVEPDAVTP